MPFCWVLLIRGNGVAWKVGQGVGYASSCLLALLVSKVLAIPPALTSAIGSNLFECSQNQLHCALPQEWSTARYIPVDIKRIGEYELQCSLVLLKTNEMGKFLGKQSNKTYTRKNAQGYNSPGNYWICNSKFSLKKNPKSLTYETSLVKSTECLNER